MTIAVTCLCGRSFAARDDLQGKRVTCPVCGKIIEVPVRAELANFDPLMSTISPARMLAPAVPAGQSSGGLRLIVIGAAAGIGITLVVGTLTIGIWSLRSRQPAQPAAQA